MSAAAILKRHTLCRVLSLSCDATFGPPLSHPTGQTSLTKDFSTQIYRQQLLGFNAVRLPFSFKDFALPGRTDYNQCIQASEQDILKSVTPPGECDS